MKNECEGLESRFVKQRTSEGTRLIGKIACGFLLCLIVACFTASLFAQEVSIPDPGLNAAIREALQIPAGPLTEQDLLRLTSLDARNRNISDIAGLEAARNLMVLQLQSNHISNLALPGTLTKLHLIDLSLNALTNCAFPSGLTNLEILILEGNSLPKCVLPPDLFLLAFLDLNNNDISTFQIPSSLTNLVYVDVGFNLLTNLGIPPSLNGLASLNVAGNSLNSLILPASLTTLTELHLSQNELSSFSLPPGLTNLAILDLFFNQITNLTLPEDLRNLTSLDLDNNKLTSFSLPANFEKLSFLHLRHNELTSVNLPSDLMNLSYLDLSENKLGGLALPAGLSNLAYLRVSDNQLGSLGLPAGMTNLTAIYLRSNQLTNLTLPPDLKQLVQIDVAGNQLSRLDLPAGLANLSTLIVASNQLGSLTLPPDVTKLSLLILSGNPFTTLVLSEELAAAGMASTVFSLQNQGLSVYIYPLDARLVLILPLVGAFKFGIIGPPGIYSILSSTNLVNWTETGVTSNGLGGVNFVDPIGAGPPKKFYRALLRSAPTNMVFIRPMTFQLGTPASELGRQNDEGPQTTVTLSHGYWIGKYEVTQREYLDVMGNNPSAFQGNLDRPVETVSFLDATNYCAKLTQRELEAGRIPTGSRYRLPTEAEWECAARAGSTNRFSYGDDPNVTNLTNYAWYSVNSGIITHPVGQKMPNSWGLYDMAGNVIEWCQDWYGPYPGGFITDPQGPPSNVQGVKVIRGGAWDAGGTDCRSGRRLTEGVSPFITDFILGFRVVLVIESN